VLHNNWQYLLMKPLSHLEPAASIPGLVLLFTTSGRVTRDSEKA
jgi:hypothetical protein